MARYEFKDDKSSKFWEITVDGATYTVVYGRLGTDGQSKTKTFASDEEARKQAQKVASAKVSKGYRLVEPGLGSPAEPAAEETQGARDEDGIDDGFCQAIMDIKEWLSDHPDGHHVLGSLLGPITPEELAEAETRQRAASAARGDLGAALPAELLWLYRQHNGQKSPMEFLTLFPVGGFLPMSRALQETDRALALYLAAPDGLATPRDRIDREHVFAKAGLLNEREYSARWFAFAYMENFHTMVNLDSGRVFEFVRQDGIYLRAESFQHFISDYASGLWDDKYRLEAAFDGFVIYPK